MLSVLATASAGCQSQPVAAPQLSAQPSTPAGVKVAYVQIRPSNRRQVADFGSTTWAGGDRLATGTTSPVWGAAPLGYGYGTNGVLPIITPNGALGSNLLLADMGAKTVYAVPALDGMVNDAVLGDGGRFAVFRSGPALGVFDFATQLVRTYPQLDSTFVRDFSVDAFGNVAYTSADRQVHLFDTRSGADFIVPVASRGLDDVANVSLSGDGRYVSYSGLSNGVSSIYVTDVGTGRQLTYPFLPSGGPHFLQSLQLSNTGDSLLYSDNGQARLLDLRTGFTDNLPLLNNGWGVNDAQLLGGDSRSVVFNRGGNVMVYDRATNLVDTLPILNNLGTFNMLADGHASLAPLY